MGVFVWVGVGYVRGGYSSPSRPDGRVWERYGCVRMGVCLRVCVCEGVCERVCERVCVRE